MNAIINKTESLENSILFVTQFPCIECTKMIVQSGIKKIIYSNKSEHNCQKISNDEEQTAKKIFELSNVMYISI
jgi:dCMP deaminase